MQSCRTCKVIKVDGDFYKSSRRKSGLFKDCISCLADYYKKRNKLQKVRDRVNLYWRKRRKNDASYRERIKQKDKKLGKTILGRFRRAKAVAKRRGIKWDLSKEVLSSLTKKPCFYCGTVLNISGGQLDRVDNTKHYFVENVVPCCLICNKMKMDLSIEIFYKHIELICSKIKSS